MSLPRLSLCTAAVLLALSTLNAQSVTTTPVGAVVTNAVGGTDTILSLTLHRPPQFVGTIASVSSNVLTLNGAAFGANALAYAQGSQSNTYYIQITSGAKAGQFSTITANSTNSVTTEFEQDILSALASGVSVAIRPYWTLGTLFPSADAGVSFVASSSNVNSGRRTEILIPNISGTGINRSASATYFHNSYWRRVGDVTPNRADVILLPDSYLIIRGTNYTTPTALTTVGEVNLSKHAVSLLAITTGQNDNPVGIPCPKDITISELGLTTGVGGVFFASTNNVNSGRGDELLVFSQTGGGINRTPSATYFYNGYWRRVGDVTPDRASTIIPAGSAVLVRKKAQATNTVTDWVIDFSNLIAAN